jgi:hypothetical protein
MVHAGEYSEPLSYTARPDANLRVADHAGELITSGFARHPPTMCMRHVWRFTFAFEVFL